jgi:hypothetical protein
VGLIESGTYISVHVLKATDDKAYQEWLDETGFDGPTVKLSSLPKEPLSKYYPDLSAGVSGFQNPKHTVKEFTFDVNCKGGPYAKASDFWVSVDVDPETDSGVYVGIERFEYETGDGYPHHPRKLRDLITLITDFGITVPTIYGFKRSSADKAEDNKNMVSFWDWLKKELQAKIDADPTLEQAWVERKYIDNEIAMGQRGLECLVAGNLNTSDVKNPINQFHAKVQAFKHAKRTKELDALTQLMNYVKFTPKHQVTFDMKGELRKLATRYPLLFTCLKHNSYEIGYQTDFRKQLVEYVNLVDTVTP